MRGRSLPGFGPLLLLHLLAVRAAGAAVLPFTATLEVTFNTLAIAFTDAGSAVVDTSGGGSHLTRLELAPGALQGTAPALGVTDPAAFPITGVELFASNSGGTLIETGGGGFGGTMGLPGLYRVCLFGDLGSCQDPIANIDIPLTVIGQGGSGAFAGAVSLTVFGAPWTTGTAAIGAITTMGFRAGPASGPSSTAQPGGVVRLVTPIYVSTNIGASVVIPAFARLTIEFVPEPGGALLLGVGLLAVGVGARRRRR